MRRRPMTWSRRPLSRARWPRATWGGATSLAPMAGETAAPHAEHHPAPPEPEPLPTAETEPGIPYTSEAERVLEGAEATTRAGAEHQQPPPEPEPRPTAETE